MATLTVNTMSPLERLLKFPLRLAPYALHKQLLPPILNRVFRQELASGDLDPLAERCLVVMVEDVGFRWHIGCEGGRLVMLEQDREADVTIRGHSREFALLATRREDPDTLFFQRRLLIEGDTELGLFIKNLMDSMDWDALPAPLRVALIAGGGLMERIGV
jgi:predicted lipid carrier protein YhbT